MDTEALLEEIAQIASTLPRPYRHEGRFWMVSGDVVWFCGFGGWATSMARISGGPNAIICAADSFLHQVGEVVRAASDDKIINHPLIYCVGGQVFRGAAWD